MCQDEGLVVLERGVEEYLKLSAVLILYLLGVCHLLLLFLLLHVL